eukprot:GFYU01000071.1.p1 GENE.GFYU01000071.1~~GFYU01000071.1.p1  ORF type:complete len:197 (-),score=39.91 GFYU01000071.1:288-878(-)
MDELECGDLFQGIAYDTIGVVLEVEATSEDEIHTVGMLTPKLVNTLDARINPSLMTAFALGDTELDHNSPAKLLDALDIPIIETEADIQIPDSPTLDPAEAETLLGLDSLDSLEGGVPSTSLDDITPPIALVPVDAPAPSSLKRKRAFSLDDGDECDSDGGGCPSQAQRLRTSNASAGSVSTSPMLTAVSAGASLP